MAIKTVTNLSLFEKMPNKVIYIFGIIQDPSILNSLCSKP